MFSREWSERSRVLWIQGSNSILHLACRDTLRCLSSLASLDLLLPLFFRLLPSSLSLAHWLTYSVETKGATGVGRKRERKRVRRGRARAEAKGWKERRKKRRKGPFFFFLPPLPLSSSLPRWRGIVRQRCVQERDEDVRASVDSGIEGGTEKERTREKEGGKRSATKVAVTPCKASKPNG